MQYHVIVNVTRREARIYMPDGTEFCVAALSEKNDQLPPTLVEEPEETPKKRKENLRVAKVMMIQTVLVVFLAMSALLTTPRVDEFDVNYPCSTLFDVIYPCFAVVDVNYPCSTLFATWLKFSTTTWLEIFDGNIAQKFDDCYHQST